MNSFLNCLFLKKVTHYCFQFLNEIFKYFVKTKFQINNSLIKNHKFILKLSVCDFRFLFYTNQITKYSTEKTTSLFLNFN